MYAKVNREKVDANERVMQLLLRSEGTRKIAAEGGGRRDETEGGVKRGLAEKREWRISYSWHCARPSGKVARIQRGCRLAGCRLLEQLSSFSHCRASRVRATDASVNLHPRRVKLSFLSISLSLSLPLFSFFAIRTLSTREQHSLFRVARKPLCLN